MGAVIGQLLPLGVGVAVSPIPIIAVTLMLKAGWSLVSSTQDPAGIDFSDTAGYPTWIGDFTGAGHSQVLFYSPPDGHWSLARCLAGRPTALSGRRGASA